MTPDETQPPSPSPTALPRVIVVDDHPLLRAGLVRALEDDGRVRVVGEAEDARRAMDLLREARPEVAVLDIAMPGEDGLSLLARMREASLPTRAVVLTMYEDAATYRRARSLGALGYVLKDSPPEEVVTAVLRAAAGETYVSAAMASTLAARPAQTPAQDPVERDLAKLTPTERRVLALLAGALTSPRIAEAMGTSPRTVHNHRANICAKLGLTGSNALLDFAVRHRDKISR